MTKIKTATAADIRTWKAFFDDCTLTVVTDIKASKFGAEFFTADSGVPIDDAYELQDGHGRKWALVTWRDSEGRTRLKLGTADYDGGN
jgi:hypothetical protein